MKRIGKSLISTGTRSYKQIWKPKHHLCLKLVSWIDKKCKICGRFINRHNTCNRCLKCYLKAKNNNPKIRAYRKKYSREYMRKKRNSLRSYKVK